MILVGATCRLSDLIGTPKGALLAVSPVAPDSLIDSAAVGSTALRENTISVTNEGGGELRWTASSKQGSTWLLLPMDSGTAPSPLLVQFDPAGLTNGVYRDTVVVQATTGGGSLEVPVRLEIHPCRPTSIQVSDARTDTLNAADCGAPHRPLSQAQVFSFSGLAGDSASIELTAGFDGHLVFDTSLTPTAPPLGEANGCLGDGNASCLYYMVLPRTTTYYIEVTSATAADSGVFKLRLLHPGRLPNAPDSLDQRLLDSTTSVASGATIGTSSLLLRAVVSDSDLVDSLRLEAEVQPIGTAFTFSPNRPPGPKVGNGQPAWVSVSGLADNTQYRWQVRTKDWTGRASPWDSFPGNPAFNVQLGNDPDPPTALNQFQSDGSTVIPVGQTANGTTVVLKAQVSDPDAGNTLQLQVEVRPIGTDFTDTPGFSSGPVASGATAEVPVAGLSGGTSYHWQARTVDNTGRRSGWVSFGNNGENAADFQVQIPPQQLVFTVQPAVDTSNRPIRPAPQVTVQDQNGNTITSFTGQVTMAIANNPAGGTLTGTTTVFAVAGVATFANLVIDKAGTPYTLQATTGTLSSVPSTAFTVVAGPASQLAFTGQPSNTPSTSPITPPVVVTALDAAGNRATSFTGNVLIAIGTNPAGGTLSGTTTMAANAGQAQFGNLSINSVGNGYTLRATSGTLTAAVSALFNITNIGSTHLTFSNQPTTTGAGVAINSGTGGVVVTAVDDVGQPVTSYTANVTITIGNNPVGGILSGTTTVAAAAGVATFSNLRIDKVGTGYTLTATGPGATSGASAAFNITAGPTSQLVFTAPPSNATAGIAIAPAVQVSAQDQFGNATPSFGGQVTVTILNNPSGGTLTGGGPITAVGGVATFSNLRINRPGISYTLLASSGALKPDTSAAFNIAAAPPVSLVFTTQPGNTTAGVAINGGSGGVVVTARDSLGNTATSFTSTVTMILGANPAGGVLSGTTNATAVAGVATFGNLRIIKAGTGYQLQASGGALTSPLSNAFTINTAPASQLTWTVQPTTTAVLARIDSAVGGVGVTVQDSVGNTVITASNSITVALFNNPTGGILGGTKTRSAVAGVATFNDLTVDKLGSYTLIANASGLANEVSASFDIIPGPAKTLAFTVQPSQTVAGSTITPAVQVTARDVQGNTATGFTGNVTVAIGTNPSSGSLSGTKVVGASSGVANFSTLTIDNAGSGYTLTASTPALPSGPVTGATSNPFDIIAGGVSATQSTIGAAPTSITACKTGCSPGANTASLITVTARDAGGNPIQGATVVLSSNGTGDNITQPATTTNASGVATGTISDTVVEPLTVRATIEAVLINPSAAVTVNAGSPAVLLFIGLMRDTTAGAALKAPGIQVRILDQFRNNVPGATNPVGISILVPPSPAGGILSGAPNPKPAVGGIATFTNLSIDQAGTGYRLLASGLPTTDTSSAFNITAGAVSASQSTVVAAQPSITACDNTPPCTTGDGTESDITVTARDQFGNVIAGAAVVVSSSGTSNAFTPSSGSTNSSGVFTSTFRSTKAEAKTISATINSVAITETAGVTVNAAGVSAGQSTVVAAPGTITASTGSSVSTITVTVKDEFANPIQGATVVLSATPTTGNTITQPASTTNSSGQATGTLSSTKAESKTVSATAQVGAGPVVPITQTDGVTVDAAAAAALFFTTEPPTTTPINTDMDPAVVVTARDQFGNTATGFSGTVTLDFTTGTNDEAAGITGNSVSASGGVATFANLQIDTPDDGSGYTLDASAAGVPTGATSIVFSITTP